MPRDLWVLHVPWMTGDPWIPRDPWMYTRPIDAVRFVDPARPVDAAETGGGDAVAHFHPSPTPIPQLDGDASDEEDPGLRRRRNTSQDKKYSSTSTRPQKDFCILRITRLSKETSLIRSVNSKLYCIVCRGGIQT